MRQSQGLGLRAWMAVAVCAAFCATGRAQEPAPLNGPGAPPPPGNGPIAPRTDVYSNYSDAYFNPDAAMPVSESGTAMVDQAIRGPKLTRLYLGQDVLTYRRNRPGNVILLRTTPNLFDDNPQQLRAPNANGVPDIFGFHSGVNNDPLENLPRGPNGPTGPNIAIDDRMNVDEFLVPNETRFQTSEFDNPARTGYRSTIGIELDSGNRIEFSYFFVQDFSSTHVDDVSGAAFNTFQISDPNSPTFIRFFRFGYLNAPFRLPVNNNRADNLPDPFAGEIRKRLNADAPATASPPGTNATAPHYPLNESPALRGDSPGIPVVFATAPGTLPDGRIVPNAPNGIRSSDLPREPTNEDPRILGATDPRYLFSLLWTDGELAVINYNFDLSGAELAYKRQIFEYNRGDWELVLIGSVRYLNMSESFNFLFADIAGPETIAKNPFDRALANPDQPQAQPSSQATATYIAGIDNKIVGPEIGINAKYPFLYLFSFDILGKAGFGANFLENEQGIIRGDGLVLYQYQKQVQSTSGFFEGHLGLTARVLPNVTLRGGWEYLWLINVGTAIGQIDFDLTRRPRPSNNEKVLWNGWYGGVEVTF